MKLFYLNLKQALRYMQRDILQYSLSTGGMILGLVCLTFSINWLWNETHYDSFRPGHEDIYAVAYLDESKTTHGFQHSYALYDYLRDSVPEIKSVGMSASVYRPKIYTEKGDDVTQTCKSIRKITPSLLTLFHVELLYGDTRTALQEGHIILSRQAAVDIFGRENVVGERLKVEDRDMYGTTQKDYTVSGIAADVPEQTNLDFDMLLWLDPDKDYSREQWGYMAVEIYYSSDHPEQAAARVSAMPHYNRACAKSVPLSEMHVLYGAESWWRGIFYPLAFTVVSFLMIASALFNYMAILTARFLGRIREYKLRLTLGGTQLANVAWLTTEVLLLLILVLLISGVMLELLTYWAGVSMAKGNIYGTYGWCSLGFVAVVLFFLAYPVATLRKACSATPAAHPGKLHNHANLLFVQLAVCVLFAFLFLNAYRQFRFMTHTDLGFDTHNILRIYTNYNSFNRTSTNLLAQRLKSGESPAVEDAIALAADLFGSGMRMGTYIRVDNEPDEDTRTISYMILPSEAFRFFHIQTDKGKGLMPPSTPGRMAVVLNSDAAQAAGYDGSGKHRYKIWYFTDEEMEAEIQGVANVQCRSFLESAYPCAFIYEPQGEWFGFHEVVYLRHAPGKEQEAAVYARQLMKDMQIPDYEIDIEPLEQFIASFYEQESTYLRVFTVIALASLVITLSGVFSVVRYTMRVQRRNIAIRRIFGATNGTLRRMYLTRYIILSLLATIVAIPTGYRLIGYWLENYSQTIPLGAWPALVIVLVIIGLVACIVITQINRATRENPANVIKTE